MDFDLPEDLAAYLEELDDFIEREIKPLEAENDNIRFFDHRRALPVRLPPGVRRPGRHQPGQGRDPRAPGPQGPRPAL